MIFFDSKGGKGNLLMCFYGAMFLLKSADTFILSDSSIRDNTQP